MVLSDLHVGIYINHDKVKTVPATNHVSPVPMESSVGSPVTSSSSTLRHSISAAGEGFADHRRCLRRSCFGDIHGVNIGSGVIEIGFVSIMFSSVLSNRIQKWMKAQVECWKHDLHCVANCHCL